MLCYVQGLVSMSRAAPTRMSVTVEDSALYVLVIHVGEGGNSTTTQRLICMLADEIELAVAASPALHTDVAAAANVLRKILSW